MPLFLRVCSLFLYNNIIHQSKTCHIYSLYKFLELRHFILLCVTFTWLWREVREKVTGRHLCLDSLSSLLSLSPLTPSAVSLPLPIIEGRRGTLERGERERNSSMLSSYSISSSLSPFSSGKTCGLLHYALHVVIVSPYSFSALILCLSLSLYLCHEEQTFDTACG